MKVLHLTTSFPLQKDSSSGIFIERLVNAFPDNVACFVLTPDSTEDLSSLKREYQLITCRYAPKHLQILAHKHGGLPVALSHSGWNIILLPGFFLSMLWHTLIHARQCDIIHAHWAMNGVIAALAGKIMRVPVLTTLRGEDAGRAGSSPVHRLFLRACLTFSDAVVSVSSKMCENLMKTFPEQKGKISFVANGVGERFYALPIKNCFERVNILVLGNLIPVKGLDVILKALAHCDSQKTWRLRLVGDGTEKHRLQELTRKLGLRKQVRFYGQISPQEVVALLAQTDILVQASYREGRPNAVLEAMAAGVSVIGSDIDGISELIEHGKNGLLFPPGDSDALALLLDRLMDSPGTCRRLGASARQTLIDLGLTWPHCAQSYLYLYNKLISKGKK